MGVVFKLLTLFLVTFPEFRLDWLTKDNNDRFKASLQGYTQQLQSCAASGLALRFRYEFQICKDHKLWFDQCNSPKRATSSFEYDPISETYLITKDFLGDVDLPFTERVDNLDKAIARTSVIEDIPVAWITNGSDQVFSGQEVVDPRIGLRGRVIVECRGNYSESVKRLSSLLSLGLIKTSEFDSGWVKFSQ